MSVCYLTPKARPAVSAIAGHGAVCIEPITSGEMVAAFGGRCVTRDEFDLLPVGQQARSVQIEEDLYLAAGPEPEPGQLINHSCRPTCSLEGNMVLVARRDIAVGDELTYDYATRSGSDYDEFECQCGDALCRGKVTGHDWMLPELQLRHRGTFSPYLARRISALHDSGARRRAFAL
ncbi:MAG: hypothetical protein JWM12_215 [Ilumatobacteraceae bacterium]|nr:hypothetical protein [Ilumatobacteraceae bacterium]